MHLQNAPPYILCRPLQNGLSIVINDTIGTLVQVRGIVSCFAAIGPGPQRRDEVQQGTVCHEYNATYRAGMDPSRTTDLTQWPPSGMRSAAALLHDEMQSYARVKALPF